MGYLGAFIAGLVLWALLWPRGTRSQLSLMERRILVLFLAIRGFLPLVFEYLGANADRFFSGGFDSFGYSARGARVATDFDLIGYSVSHREVPGTGSVDLAAGWFIHLTGDTSRMPMVYLWTWLATLGIVLFWWNTRSLIAHRRDLYALWALCAPTLLFWNSTLGKEAPIMLGIGCLTASVALLMGKGSAARALCLGALGLLLTVMIRPHIPLMLLLAVGLAVVWSYATRSAQVRKRPQRRPLLLLVVVGGLVLSVSLSTQLLGAESAGTLVDAAYDFGERGAIGRSGVEAQAPRSVADVPGALITTLFRPFLWESRTVFYFFAAAESTLVFLLLVRAGRRIGSVWNALQRHPLVLAAAFYTAIFSSAVVGYGNLGLIVRQKMQVWPFVILLIFAIQSEHFARRPSRDPRAVGAADSRALADNL